MQAPLLDPNAPWKQRFRASGILGTMLAPRAPERGLAVSNASGVVQLYAWEVPTGELRQLTDRPTGVLVGWIAPDGRYIYYLNDEQGNELGHFVRVPFEGGETEDITPALPPYGSWNLSISRACNLLATVAADADGFHLYALDMAQDGVVSAPRTIYESRNFTQGIASSHNGELVATMTTERSRSLHTSLIVLDPRNGELVSELWDGLETSIQLIGFAPLPDDLRLLATTNRDGVIRPLIWSPHTGKRIDLSLDALRGDIHPLSWSLDGNRLLLCQFNQAVQQLYIYDLRNTTLTRLDHPAGTFGFGGIYFASDDEIFAQWMDSAHPPQLLALDASTGTKKRTVLQGNDVPPGRRWRSVTFTSSDGCPIQGWLAVPEGQGPFPTILETHGGPEAVATELFVPSSQAWLDHGYAFLTINYRGSTTFGREFREHIWGNPGHWEVEDMVAARDWLVQQGIAKPDAIFLTGWSYGGYLTLLALGKRPELWAGGMAGVAIADWNLMYEDQAPTLRGYQKALFGGSPEEKPEQYVASSPITYAAQVQAPVLVIQGSNDTRCPARQLEVYEARMRELGKSIHVHWFEAGHAALVVEQQIQHQELMLSFAYDRLKGP